MRTNSGQRPSITSHPLFPVIVVLWCGALFGVASLAIRTEMIENAVVAAGIDGVVPMAAPPLGKTARILIALLATGLGCLVGLVVMRRASKPRAEAPVRRRRAEAKPAAPIDEEAQDKQVAEVEKAPLLAPGRRRRFAMMRDEQADDSDPAPTPAAQILNVADLDPDAFASQNDAPGWIRTIDSDEGAPPEPAQDRDTSLFDSYARSVRPQAEQASAEPGFELLSRPHEDASQSRETSLQEAAVAEDWRPSAHGSAAERIASAPLDELSPVELLERLAISIERRRAAAKAVADTAVAQAEPVTPVVEQAVEPAPLPAALRPIDPEADYAADEPLPGYVPPRHIGLSASTVTPPSSTLSCGDDEDVLAEGYSSLRNLSRSAEPAPVSQRPVAPRFDRPANFNEPQSVYPFPAQLDSDVAAAPTKPVRAFDAPASLAPSSRESADADLRAALATLQRMSGAA